MRLSDRFSSSPVKWTCTVTMQQHMAILSAFIISLVCYCASSQFTHGNYGMSDGAVYFICVWLFAVFNNHHEYHYNQYNNLLIYIVDICVTIIICLDWMCCEPNVWKQLLKINIRMSSITVEGL